LSYNSEELDAIQKTDKQVLVKLTLNYADTVITVELNHGYTRNEIITKQLFQLFISHVTTSETEIKLFHLL